MPCTLNYEASAWFVGNGSHFLVRMYSLIVVVPRTHFPLLATSKFTFDPALKRPKPCSPPVLRTNYSGVFNGEKKLRV